jgi:hypothetical protein
MTTLVCVRNATRAPGTPSAVPDFLQPPAQVQQRQFENQLSTGTASVHRHHRRSFAAAAVSAAVPGSGTARSRPRRATLERTTGRRPTADRAGSTHPPERRVQRPAQERRREQQEAPPPPAARRRRTRRDDPPPTVLPRPSCSSQSSPSFATASRPPRAHGKVPRDGSFRAASTAAAVRRRREGRRAFVRRCRRPQRSSSSTSPARHQTRTRLPFLRVVAAAALPRRVAAAWINLSCSTSSL